MQKCNYSITCRIWLSNL